MEPTAAPFSLNDFRAAAASGAKLPMLTCYDYTTAKLLARAGIRLLLVGDSAANVILGHPTTLPVPLDFMIELAAAVKRGAPDALVFADLPFGSAVNTAGGARAAVEMIKRSNVDCLKIEASRGHLGLVQRLADSGVAVFAHLGLTPQSVGLMGGYKAQGKSAQDAYAIADLAGDLVNAGAAGILLEAVPPEVSELIVQQLDVPVIGCGAGPACHAHVVVLQDLIGLSERTPKFVTPIADAGKPIVEAAQRFGREIASGKYPAKQHCYQMPADEAKLLKQEAKKWGFEIKGLR
jgi:3-methyl-2-oxobutanoate hydroxymethyltransferase